MVVFMGLHVAISRLIYGTPPEWGQVVDLLWNLALRAEDGDLADADRALAEAERALEDALANGASPEEIRDKVDALRRAMQRYMQAMMKQMPHLADMPPMPADAMSSQDLDAMLQQLGDLGELGARDAAQAMLDNLRQMLTDLREARPLPAEALRQMRQTMDALNAIAEDQEDLLDRTFRDHREAFTGRRGPRSSFLPPLLKGSGEAPEVPEPSSSGQQSTPATSLSPEDREALADGARLAAEQEALQKTLQSLLDGLGPVGAAPPSLGAAAKHMRGAANALAGAAWAPATEAQGAALDALRQGLQQTAQSILRGMGTGMTLMPGGGRRDGSPHGRTPGDLNAPGVKVPTDAAASRARDIMMELRRRSNDRDRPDEERDYIRRLLERF